MALKRENDNDHNNNPFQTLIRLCLVPKYFTKKKKISFLMFGFLLWKIVEKKNQKQLKLVIELCIFKLFNIYIKELK